MMLRFVHLAIVALALSNCASDVTFPSTGNNSSTRVSGLLFKPEGDGVYPAVILLHTCGGMKPHVTEHWPNYLTGLGYVVLSVDSYGPRGISRCSRRVGWDMQIDDAYGALTYLSSLPFVERNRVGLMGFSRGAMAINGPLLDRTRTGRRPDFKAAIALYGRCHDIWNYTEKDIPLLEIVGENDRNLTPSCIEAGRRFPIRVHVIKGAYHAFDSPGSSGRSDPFGNLMVYSAQAVSEAERYVEAFLAKHLRD